MIDLNSPEYNMKEFLTKENLLKYVNDYSIFRYYVGEFHVGGIMSNPFRVDNKPSFGIFFSKKYNCFLFKDLATGDSGDFISLVNNYLYPHFTWKETLGQIAYDFGLSDRFIMPRFGYQPSSQQRIQIFKDIEKHIDFTRKELGIVSRKYTSNDYKFWALFGVSRNTLKRYRVVPISYFTYGNKTYKADTLAFAFIEKKDNITTYKIYQPYSKSLKFFTDMDASVHSGYSQLPKTGEVLIITKSLKDVMSITENTEYNAISVLCETVSIKNKVMDEYKQRFRYVCVLFDNDEAGDKMAERYREDFEIPKLEIPYYFENCTDFTDVTYRYNLEQAVDMLDNLVYTKVLVSQIDDLPF